MVPKPKIVMFISYSHKDERLCEKLRTHLASLARDDVEICYDNDILPGEEIDPRIRKDLKRSNIFIALASPDYLHSNYCFEIEYRYALGRARRKTMHVVAAIVRPCQWKNTRMQRYKSLPKDGKPASLWTNADKAYEDIVDGIRRVVSNARTTPGIDINPIARPSTAKRKLARSRANKSAEKLPSTPRDRSKPAQRRASTPKRPSRAVKKPAK